MSHIYRNTFTMLKYSKQQLQYLILEMPDNLLSKIIE